MSRSTNTVNDEPMSDPLTRMYYQCTNTRINLIARNPLLNQDTSVWSPATVTLKSVFMTTVSVSGLDARVELIS
jgi:hypothetical protein